MTNRSYQELTRKLSQARRLASEPNDPLTRDRLALLIKDLRAEIRSLLTLRETF
jgi:hypothetical protein